MLLIVHMKCECYYPDVAILRKVLWHSVQESNCNFSRLILLPREKVSDSADEGVENAGFKFMPTYLDGFTSLLGRRLYFLILDSTTPPSRIMKRMVILTTKTQI